MSDARALAVPDLGDFEDVEVIEVLVARGDSVAVDDPLITLETDKASMDVPADAAGVIAEVKVKVGDRVSAGDVVAVLESAPRSDEPAAGADGENDAQAEDDTRRMTANEIKSATAKAREQKATHSVGLVVIGSGPGGYTAAFRAADLGLDVMLIERYPTLGGVCLNVGCIPSKALLHAAKVIDDVEAMAAHGIRYGAKEIDAARLCEWKDQVVGRLTRGLSQLAKQRKVRLVQATARFESPNRLRLDNDETVHFDQCIIAAGSEAAMLPGLPDDERIVDSTGALELAPLPRRLLVVGGGIIGLEMACVYAALGTRVSVAELTDALMPGTDPDLVRPFRKIVDKRYEAIMLSTRVTAMKAREEGIEVAFEGAEATGSETYDRVLVAVGRRANGDRLDAERAGVEVDSRGIIGVDRQMRSSVPHIFAIGDLAGGPMLAHKANHEGRIAAEVAAGQKRHFDARVIPSVAYTDPEIAWVGVTESEAKKNGTEYVKSQFPWAASGRSLTIGRDEGLTKLLFDKRTGRVIGGGIVGTGAGDLISEVALAIEMGADAEDLGLTIHPHPTLSETIMFAAEAEAGTLTELYLPKKR